MAFGYGNQPWDAPSLTPEGRWVTYGADVRGACSDCGCNEMAAARRTTRDWLGHMSTRDGYACRSCRTFTTTKPAVKQSAPPRPLTAKDLELQRQAAAAQAKLLDDVVVGIIGLFGPVRPAYYIRYDSGEDAHAELAKPTAEPNFAIRSLDDVVALGRRIKNEKK